MTDDTLALTQTYLYLVAVCHRLHLQTLKWICHEGYVPTSGFVEKSMHMQTEKDEKKIAM